MGAATRLALDAAAVDLVRALRSERVRAILIKGPATAARLYDDPAERHYGDIDLLVEQRSVPAAERILDALGFRDMRAGAGPSDHVNHANPWQRIAPPRVTVDLHTRIYWYNGPPCALWAELGRATARIEIGGEPIEVLGDSAQALVVATHAVQHGASAKPLEDLERALTRIDHQAWREAAAIAARLDLAAPFAAGLSRTAAGARLVDELRIEADASVEMRLRLAGAPALSLDFARLAASPPRDRVALIIGRLIPSPSIMRLIDPQARRGKAGLALAYLKRLFRVTPQAPAALRAWRAVSVPRSGRCARADR